MQEKQTKNEAQVLIFAQKSNKEEEISLFMLKSREEDDSTVEEFYSKITTTDSDVAYFDGKILFFETHKMGYGYTPEGIIIVEYDDRNSNWDIRLFMKPEIDDILLFSADDSSIAGSEEEITEEIKFMIEKKFRETSYRVRDLTQGQNWYQARDELRRWLWEFYKKYVFGSEPDYKFNEKFEQIVNQEIIELHKNSNKIQIWEDLMGKSYYYADLTYQGNYKARECKPE